MGSDPLAPHVEGQRRVVGVGPQLIPARDRAGDTVRHDVDLAHARRVPDAHLDGGIVGRSARPRCGSTRPHPRGGPLRVPRSRTRPRVWGNAFAPGAAKPETSGEHQVAHDPVAFELEHQELAAAPHARAAAGRRAPRSPPPCPASRSTAPRWCPSRGVRRGPRGSRPRGCRGRVVRASQHRTSYLWRHTACGRLRGHCPQEGRAARAPERRSLSSPPATRTTSRSRKPGRAARALSSPGREPHHPRRCIHLTEPQQEETGTEPTSPTTIADETAAESVDAAITDEVSPVTEEAAAAAGDEPEVTEEVAAAVEAVSPLPPRPSPPEPSEARGRRDCEPVAAEPRGGRDGCRSSPCRVCPRRTWSGARRGAGARAGHRHAARADDDGGAAQRAGRRDPEPQAR